MTSISPTQLGILKAAAKTPLEDIRQHMQELKSPAIRDKVLQSMLKNGLVKEAEEDGGGGPPRRQAGGRDGCLGRPGCPARGQPHGRRRGAGPRPTPICWASCSSRATRFSTAG